MRSGCSRKEIKKKNIVWCYPGLGTPSTCTNQSREAVVKSRPVGVDDVFNLGTRRRSGRVPKVIALRKIVEKQPELKTKRTFRGTVMHLTETQLF